MAFYTDTVYNIYHKRSVDCKELKVVPGLDYAFNIEYFFPIYTKSDPFLTHFTNCM